MVTAAHMLAAGEGLDNSTEMFQILPTPACRVQSWREREESSQHLQLSTSTMHGFSTASADVHLQVQRCSLLGKHTLLKGHSVILVSHRNGWLTHLKSDLENTPVAKSKGRKLKHKLF